MEKQIRHEIALYCVVRALRLASQLELCGSALPCIVLTGVGGGSSAVAQARPSFVTAVGLIWHSGTLWHCSCAPLALRLKLCGSCTVLLCRLFAATQAQWLERSPAPWLKPCGSGAATIKPGSRKLHLSHKRTTRSRTIQARLQTHQHQCQRHVKHQKRHNRSQATTEICKAT
jgi:hypothetical protein